MFRTITMAACAMVLASCATTQTVSPPPPAQQNADAGADTAGALLNDMVGQWVLSGVIAGDQTVHDVEADWVLGRSYVRITEVSRERDESGSPLYEAIIFVGWLERENRFVCFWFDNTEVTTPGVTCSAAQAGNAIPFEFRDTQGALIFFNTFTYDRNAGTWQWNMEGPSGEGRETFGLVTLQRR